MFASLGHLRITFLVPNLLFSKKKKYKQINFFVVQFEEDAVNIPSNFGVDRPDEPECEAVVVPLLVVAVAADVDTITATFGCCCCGGSCCSCCCCTCCCGIVCSVFKTSALCKSCEINVPFSSVAL